MLTAEDFDAIRVFLPDVVRTVLRDELSRQRDLAAENAALKAEVAYWQTEAKLLRREWAEGERETS